MRHHLLPRALGALIMVLIAFGAVAIAVAGDDPKPEPLAFGTDPSEWTADNGQPIVALAPDRAPVSTFDGGILRDASGDPVTVPQGELYRGEISEQEADRQFAEVDRLQREDACRRGVEIPLSGSGTSDTSMEESLENAKRDLAAKLAANGGRPGVSACD